MQYIGTLNLRKRPKKGNMSSALHLMAANAFVLKVIKLKAQSHQVYQACGGMRNGARSVAKDHDPQ